MGGLIGVPDMRDIQDLYTLIGELKVRIRRLEEVVFGDGK
jgi:hypothetical protein